MNDKCYKCSNNHTIATCDWTYLDSTYGYGNIPKKERKYRLCGKCASKIEKIFLSCNEKEIPITWDKTK